LVLLIVVIELVVLVKTVAVVLKIAEFAFAQNHGLILIGVVVLMVSRQGHVLMLIIVAQQLINLLLHKAAHVMSLGLVLLGISV
jgi:hypothetical protein